MRALSWLRAPAWGALLFIACFGACSGGSRNSDGGGGSDGGDGGTDLALPPIPASVYCFPRDGEVWSGGILSVSCRVDNGAEGDPWTMRLTQVEGGSILYGQATTVGNAYGTLAVDVPADYEGPVTATAEFTRGAEVLSGSVAFTARSPATADAPGFALYGVPEQDTFVSGGTIAYQVRVLSLGGFAGDVHVMAHGLESLRDVRFTEDVVRVAPGAPASLRVEADTYPPAIYAQFDYAGVSLVARSGRLAPVYAELPPSRAPFPSTTTAVVEVPRTVQALPGEVVPVKLRERVWPLRRGDLVPTITYAFDPPAPGFTLDSDGLHVDASVEPGVRDLPFVMDVTDTQRHDRATGVLHVSVVGEARDGWQLVSGKPAGRSCTARGVYVYGDHGLVEGPDGRCELGAAGWATTAMEPNGNGPDVRIVQRGTERLTTHASQSGGIAVLYENEPGGTVKNWDLGDLGGTMGSWFRPTAAVDKFGDLYAGYLSATPSGVSLGLQRWNQVDARWELPLALFGHAPYVAGHGDTVALALVGQTAFDGPYEILPFTLRRTPQGATWSFSWVEAAPLDAVPVAPALVSFAVDYAERPIIAWVGADEHIHVSRLEGGAWSELGSFAPMGSNVVLEVELRVGAPERVVVGWREALHEVDTAAFAVPTRNSVVRLAVKDGSAAFVERPPLRPLDPRSPQRAFAFNLDDTGKPVVAVTEGDLTRVERTDAP